MKYSLLIAIFCLLSLPSFSQNKDEKIEVCVGKSFLRNNFEWWHGIHSSVNFNNQIQANLNIAIGIENTYRQRNFNPLASFAVGYDFLNSKNTLAIQWNSSLSGYDLSASTRINYWTNTIGYYFSFGRKWKFFQSSYLGRGKEFVNDYVFNFWAYQIETGIKYVL